jgi:chemotaxis response regulator CheB
MIGRKLMSLGKLKIYIIDDQETYFSKNILEIVKKAGFSSIERYYIVNKELLEKLLSDPPDIIILDIKGITEKDVAKNGFGIAKVMFEKTNSYVVVTSAHKFYLHETHKQYDYVIQERLLTAVDLIDELTNIVENYLKYKINFYKKITFRIGFKIVKKALMSSTD